MIANQTPNLQLGTDTWDVGLPILPRDSWKWICDNIRTKEKLPFNYLDYPWGEGIAKEWDNPRRRTVALQFAARLGKTTLANALMICALEHNPRPGMIGTTTETLLKEQVRDKYYPMLEHCNPTMHLVPDPKRRVQTRIDLLTCRVYGAWAGSTTQLADKDPAYLHGGEIDKWSKNTSDEADPLYLFTERGAEIPDRKLLLESTPSIAERSRINRILKNGTDCRFQVPCPQCGTYQVLILGNGTGAGIIWDKNESGESEPDLAFSTARYRCGNCAREIHDDQKRGMSRRGVWVPRGQRVSKTGRLLGAAHNDGPDATFQLSRIYAPTFTFGDVAREYVSSKHDIERYRNFINSWQGDVWAPHKSAQQWQEVANRLCLEYEARTCPEDVVFLTVGVDVQIDHWVYVTTGWTSEMMGYVIDYGVTQTWDELKDEVIDAVYPHGDGDVITPIFNLIDARDGNRMDEVIDFCKSTNNASGPWVWPLLGTKTSAMGNKPFTRQAFTSQQQMKRSRRTGLKEVEVVKVNTNFYQAWLQSCLERRTPGEKLSLALPRDAYDDQDFIDQLLNEVPDFKETQTGHEELRWVVVSRHIPVDFRDATRYSKVAADTYTNNNWERVAKRRIKPKEPEAKKSELPPDKPARVPEAVEPQPEATSKWLRKSSRSRFIRG